MSWVDLTSAILATPADGAGTTFPEPRRAAKRPAGDSSCHGPVREAFHRLNYRAGQLLGRSVFFCTMKVRVVRPHAPERQGGYVLACTHLSHLDPFCAGILVNRKVDWMARLEFFRRRLPAALLWAVDAFPVKRAGVPVRAIRTAVARARAGRVIGIFPEGGVATGAASVTRGGPIKAGACAIAQRAGVPIIPCVVLGTPDLNRVGPWLPARRARLWVIYGTPVEPRPNATGRAARREMSERLRQEFMGLYQELRRTHDVPEWAG